MNIVTTHANKLDMYDLCIMLYNNWKNDDMVFAKEIKDYCNSKT